jgi:hypothetical protein
MLDEAHGRHKDLAHLHTPPEPRRQSIINRKSRRPRAKARTIHIWRAGVNAFLRKPQDIGRLSAMVTRLLTKNSTSK